jgi:alanine racemase
MIKANAYGHGVVPVAKALQSEGCFNLGVALFEEGRELRTSGIAEGQILVFYPLQTQADIDAALEYKLTPVISSWSSLELLEKSPNVKNFDVHIKFNTGMNRLGFSVDQALRLQSFFNQSKKLKLRGVCTHLLAGEDFGAQKSRSLEQIEQFLQLRRLWPQVSFHALNSSGLIALSCHAAPALSDMGARPGLSLYGVRPELTNTTPEAFERWLRLDLRPVMNLSTTICHVQEVGAGQTVSYGGCFKAEKNSIIGIVGVGYADGYFRHFSNVGAMLWRGRRVPVSGTVCMDFTMLDLTEVCAKQGIQSQAILGEILGEEVVVLGSQSSETITADKMARMIGTNPYEIFTNVSQRVPRMFV